MTRGIPLRSQSLGVLFADEMEAVGDEALDLDAVVVEMGEETLDRGLEGGIGGEILVPPAWCTDPPGGTRSRTGVAGALPI
jgi:hypothetical protein